MTDKEKIEHLQGQLSAALSRNSELESRITELEALVLKLMTVKTSKNSHNPPSSDKFRHQKSLREKSGKPVGGQKGHDGKTLKMVETPDVTEKIYPNYCQVCGVSLADASFELASRRQVIDIPPIVPVVTEYQSYAARCSCGHRQCGLFPSGVDNHVQYGKNIQSLAIYQSYYQFLPFKRLQYFFREVCHVGISKGTLENILRRNAAKAHGAYQAIKQVIEASAFVGADETSCKVNGSKNWIWVWQNAAVTYLVAAASRTKDIVCQQFPAGLPNAILASDRLAAQLSTPTAGKQICLAHLLRELNYLIAAEKNAWAGDFKELLVDAIHLKHLQKSYPHNHPDTTIIEQRTDKLLHPDILLKLSEEPWLHQKTITFFQSMVKLRDTLLPFLYHPDVPFDNNGSERAFRMVKVKDKVSGQFKSLQQPFAVIRSVIDSANKNGQPVFQAIMALVDIPITKQHYAAG